jgi:hypothetical protein
MRKLYEEAEAEGNCSGPQHYPTCCGLYVEIFATKPQFRQESCQLAHYTFEDAEYRSC